MLWILGQMRVEDVLWIPSVSEYGTKRHICKYVSLLEIHRQYKGVILPMLSVPGGSPTYGYQGVLLPMGTRVFTPNEYQEILTLGKKKFSYLWVLLPMGTRVSPTYRYKGVLLPMGNRGFSYQ